MAANVISLHRQTPGRIGGNSKNDRLVRLPNTAVLTVAIRDGGISGVTWEDGNPPPNAHIASTCNALCVCIMCIVAPRGKFELKYECIHINVNPPTVSTAQSCNCFFYSDCSTAVLKGM